MPQTAKAQFMKRAREALEQGNTKFVARGENKELFEEMKRKFEQEKNDEPDSKRVKLPALAPAPQTESDYSSDTDSEDNKSSRNRKLG